MIAMSLSLESLLDFAVTSASADERSDYDCDDYPPHRHSRHRLLFAVGLHGHAVDDSRRLLMSEAVMRNAAYACFCLV